MTPDHLAAERTIEVVEAELQSAMLRLGALGFSPKMPADLADLCARLGAMGSHGFKDYPTHSINPVLCSKRTKAMTHVITCGYARHDAECGPCSA